MRMCACSRTLCEIVLCSRTPYDAHGPLLNAHLVAVLYHMTHEMHVFEREMHVFEQEMHVLRSWNSLHEG